jgi:hypothetical protein
MDITKVSMSLILRELADPPADVETLGIEVDRLDTAWETWKAHAASFGTTDRRSTPAVP